MKVYGKYLHIYIFVFLRKQIKYLLAYIYQSVLPKTKLTILDSSIQSTSSYQDNNYGYKYDEDYQQHDDRQQVFVSAQNSKLLLDNSNSGDSIHNDSQNHINFLSQTNKQTTIKAPLTYVDHRSVVMRKRVNDLVNLTCISSPSKPAARLIWLADNEVLASSSISDYQYPSSYPVSSSLNLQLRLQPKHFKTNPTSPQSIQRSLEIKCIAHLSLQFTSTSSLVVPISSSSTSTNGLSNDKLQKSRTMQMPPVVHDFQFNQKIIASPTQAKFTMQSSPIPTKSLVNMKESTNLSVSNNKNLASTYNNTSQVQKSRALQPRVLLTNRQLRQQESSIDKAIGSLIDTNLNEPVMPSMSFKLEDNNPADSRVRLSCYVQDKHKDRLAFKNGFYDDVVSQKLTWIVDEKQEIPINTNLVDGYNLSTGQFSFKYVSDLNHGDNDDHDAGYDSQVGRDSSTEIEDSSGGTIDNIDDDSRSSNGGTAMSTRESEKEINEGIAIKLVLDLNESMRKVRQVKIKCLNVIDLSIATYQTQISIVNANINTENNKQNQRQQTNNKQQQVHHYYQVKQKQVSNKNLSQSNSAKSVRELISWLTFADIKLLFSFIILSYSYYH